MTVPRLSRRSDPRTSLPPAPRLEPTRTRWGLLLAVWTVPAVISAAQATVNAIAMGERMRWQWAASALPIWYAWVLFTPLVLWLGRRVPIERDRLGRALAIHAAAAVAITVVHTLPFTWMQLSLRRALEPQLPIPPLPVVLLGSISARLLVDLFTYGAVLGVGTAIDLGRRYRERELRAAQLESQLAGARLAALKMQLQPHFLFNTLHAIGVLVREDPPTATRMVARLGDLLRATLSRADDQEVPLERELELLRLYLEIEQIRFHDRLTVQYDVAADTVRAHVPDMILQPIVENAIRHGIAPDPDAGRIVLSSRRRGATLELRVIDDGPGLGGRAGNGGGNGAANGGGNGNGGHGVGLAATRARLEGLYGPAHRLTIADAPQGGCEVTIELPFRVIERITFGAVTPEPPPALRGLLD